MSRGIGNIFTMSTRSWRGLLAGLAAALLAAMAAQPAAAQADPCQTQQAGSSQNVFLDVDGFSRGMHVHVPPNVALGRRQPLLISLFAGTGTSMEAFTGFSALADRKGFLVIYADALRHKWAIQTEAKRGVDDVEFVREAIEWAEANYCVDSGRVFAAGVSNGGGEAARLACELGDRLLAVAAVAGAYRRVPSCEPDRPVSVLEIHSTQDHVAPYLGFAQNKSDSVPVFLGDWRKRDRCGVPGTHRRIDASTVSVFWRCAAGAVVGQYKLSGIGHAWPGVTTAATQPPGPLSAAVWIWDFFASLPPRA